MRISKRFGRPLAAVAISAAVAGSVLIAAPAARAYGTGHGKISCSAVKVRKSPAKNATALGVAYRGDAVAYDQFAYVKAEKTRYTRGTVTRKSGHAKIRGYVFYDCANPYGTDPIPKPPISKLAGERFCSAPR